MKYFSIWAIAGAFVLANLVVASEEFCSSSGESFFYSEKIDIKRNKRIITSNSCPNHYAICQDNFCFEENLEKLTLSQVLPVVYEVPLRPVLASKLTDTGCSSGTIAVAFNGVPIYSANDGTSVCGLPSQYGQSVQGNSCPIHGETDGTRYCGDAVKNFGDTFDKCGGHVDPGGKEYHYHSIPSCLLQQLIEQSNTTALPAPSVIPTPEASPQIAWALDGFPVFGPRGPQGILMQPCNADSAADDICLDKCNGYYGALPNQFDDGYMYRYYVSGNSSGNGLCSEKVKNGGTGECTKINDPCCTNTVPAPAYFPYTLGCFRGCPVVATTNTSTKDTYVPSNTFPCIPAARGTTKSFIPRVSSVVATETFAKSFLNLTDGWYSEWGMGYDMDTVVSENVSPPVEVTTSDVLLSRSVFRYPNNRSLGILNTLSTTTTEVVSNENTTSRTIKVSMKTN